MLWRFPEWNMRSDCELLLHNIAWHGMAWHSGGVLCLLLQRGAGLHCMEGSVPCVARYRSGT
jgi:hypothetical protein